MEISIKVPATSANLGLGFDSIGVAVNKFLEITASPSPHWQFEFETDFLVNLPRDEQNLVARTAIVVAQKYQQTMPPLSVKMRSDIPLTHGLGSSSSAIVAGVELANHFCQLNLSEAEKIEFGSEMEGHPDNVGPCITGGVFIGAYDEGTLVYETFELDNVALIISVPPYELSTEKARNVLPTTYQKHDAVMQNALNNVMVAALIKGDYQKMGQLMMRDRLHEPYRQVLIPEFEMVRKLAMATGAYASVISGAGPTILTLCEESKADTIICQLQMAVASCQHECVDIYQPN
ncbi:homoserine kinase [Tuanshanicoccus lijuaniae]|uniref:homoserine kinase n=1 Tax=Aerococcaceae bacterium zg-1292 TaxID=2774330 RepID=UPI001934DA8F|nr:homoserine kinase [Aerococcaceae bacterium zg-1292]QQA37637.1 homoserine kinase [Aerococcaceae bacterium zg-1292]